MRASVLIPCVARHIGLLPELFNHLARQTVRPDEVVVSVSGAATMPTAVANAAALHRFPIRILPQPGFANAARNRNLAADASKGELLIYQDADDLPHPQRVELLRALFETYEIDHAVHYFTRQHWSPGERYEARTVGSEAQGEDQFVFSYHVTNGNPATTRGVHKTVWWPENLNVGEDVHFNTAACAKFRSRSAVLRLPLLLYRQHLSGTQYR